MDSLVGYGSDDDNETQRYTSHRSSGSAGVPGASRRRDDGDNYDAVNMDLSEEESEPELPQAEPAKESRAKSRDSRGSRDSREKSQHRGYSDDSRSRDSDRSRDKDRDRNKSRDKDRRSPHRDDRHRSDRSKHSPPRRGSSGRSLGPAADRSRPPPLMDVRPFPDHDARDAVSPRFVDRNDRRDKDRSDRERERDRDRHGRRSQEKSRSGGSRYSEERTKPHGPPQRTNYAPPSSISEHRPAPCSSGGGAPAPTGASSDYRPSYKVNKKLEVMEKMGLQIKTPDGSMRTAQQLRAAAGDGPPGLNAGPHFSAHASAVLDQVQKRKLLWSKKDKSEAEQAAKWSGARFAQDNDGKQVSKFMRLMGVKEPAAIKPEASDKVADPIKKQEELFQAMQAQYEVARQTTHTMRGVGLGFQRQ